MTVFEKRAGVADQFIQGCYGSMQDLTPQPMAHVFQFRVAAPLPAVRDQEFA